MSSSFIVFIAFELAPLDYVNFSAHFPLSIGLHAFQTLQAFLQFHPFSLLFEFFYCINVIFFWH